MIQKYCAYGVTGLLCLSTWGRGEEWLDFVPVPESSRVEVFGTSSMHDWMVQSDQFDCQMKIERGMLSAVAKRRDRFELSRTNLNIHMTVTIPGESLKSGKKIMDSKMHKALKTQDHPNIQYQLKQAYRLPAETPLPSDGGWVSTRGELTVAGVLSEVSIPMQLQVLDNNQVQWTGTYALKMTDFGIKPPTAMLGAMKTGDEVSVSFKWLLGEQNNP